MASIFNYIADLGLSIVIFSTTGYKLIASSLFVAVVIFKSKLTMSEVSFSLSSRTSIPFLDFLFLDSVFSSYFDCFGISRIFSLNDALISVGLGILVVFP